MPLLHQRGYIVCIDVAVIHRLRSWGELLITFPLSSLQSISNCLGVSSAVKRQHGHGKSYKRKHLIGSCNCGFFYPYSLGTHPPATKYIHGDLFLLMNA